MTVDDHIDHVVLQHSEIGFPEHRGRCPKQDVRDVGADHAATPPIGESGAHGVLEDVDRILVVTHVGAVQRFDHLAVDTARDHALFLPQLLALLGSPFDRDDGTALLAELGDVEVGEIVGDLLRRAVLERDVVQGGDIVQFGDIADLIAFGFAVRDGLEGESHVASVVRMRGRPGGDGSNEVAGLDGVYRGATNPGHAVLGDPAGTHAAQVAAQTRRADRARGRCVRPAEGGGYALLIGQGQHLLGSRVD